MKSFRSAVVLARKWQEILVVDEIMTAKMIQDLVESFGHICEVVHNGTDGLDRLKFYDFALAR
ncbi:MAG: hypothetical protein K2X93_08580 [Candidatus Obscuribacterales bacterium]|nr:hypothetical protein [Candidatus Obscuribacterales bacterium]